MQLTRSQDSSEEFVPGKGSCSQLSAVLKGGRAAWFVLMAEDLVPG
jgi:hypothetical protein